LTLGKIITIIVATMSDFKAKMYQFSAPPEPLTGLSGLLLRGGDGKGRRNLGEGRGQDLTPYAPLIHISG